MNDLLRSALNWMSIDQLVDTVWRTAWNSLIGPSLQMISRIIPARFQATRFNAAELRECVVGLLLLLPLLPSVAAVISSLIGNPAPGSATGWATWGRFLVALALMQRLNITESMRTSGPSQGWFHLLRYEVHDPVLRQAVIKRFFERAAMAALLISVSATSWPGVGWYLLGAVIVLGLNVSRINASNRRSEDISETDRRPSLSLQPVSPPDANIDGDFIF